jgi:hypothetical protein
MKTWIALALSLLASGCASDVSARACSIPGEPIQWQADYCLFKSGTDDLIAAQPCMDHESTLQFRNGCDQKQHYKQSLCKLIINAGSRAGSVEQCIQDPEFSGPTVRNGGA